MAKVGLWSGSARRLRRVSDCRSCVSCDREFTQAGAGFDQACRMAVAACAAPTGG
ncbi:hypothetical protein LC55x_2774 [Lysobacter capsici]|nr:hypothetical protein LC55x_2774 [Lysobacter capsici]